MSRIKEGIPNFVTSLNLACGAMGIILITNHEIQLASLFIFLGLIFDFADGFIARALNVSSKVGKELDSLADIVTFCVLPMLILYNIQTKYVEYNHENIYILAKYIPTLLPIFGGLRLARFNTLEETSGDFSGLAVPAAAIFIASLPFFLIYPNAPQYFFTIILNPWFNIILSIVFALLYITPIPLISFKFKDKKFKNNKIRYIFLFISLVLIILKGILAVPIIIFLYLLTSFSFIKKKNKVYEIPSKN